MKFFVLFVSFILFALGYMVGEFSGHVHEAQTHVMQELGK